MDEPKKLASHHILRRNRIIDNLIHQFSVDDPKLPNDDCKYKQFYSKMQDASFLLKEQNYQQALHDVVGVIDSDVNRIRIDVIGRTDIVFMKQKFPKEYELARRCKNLQHSLRNLSVSLRMYPNEMPGKYAALPKKGRPEKLKMFEIKGMHETIDHGHFCYCDYFSGKDLREAMNRFFDKFPATDEIIYAHEYKGGPR